MYNGFDHRRALTPGQSLQTEDCCIVIDKFLGSCDISLRYLAHMQGSSRTLMLKELFPRTLERGMVPLRSAGKITVKCTETCTDESQSNDCFDAVRQCFYDEAEMLRRINPLLQGNEKGKKKGPMNALSVMGPFQDVPSDTVPRSLPLDNWT